jgi:MoaA/NifB/PqqE/SkfB family radical SAM enzyme
MVVYEKSVSQPSLKIEWEITYACNLRCRHCYNASGQSQTNELSTREALQLINEIAEMRVFEVGISGGEPLLRSDLFELLTALKTRRIRTYLCTNGTLINDDITQQILESKVSHVMVSLDGASSKTHDSIRGRGSYSKAILRPFLPLNSVKSGDISKVL